MAQYHLVKFCSWADCLAPVIAVPYSDILYKHLYPGCDKVFILC